MSEQPRKPYLDSKKSVGDFFRAHVRWLKASTEKESQFEKPYLTGEYRLMHLELPQWNWGGRRYRPIGLYPSRIGREGIGSTEIHYPRQACSLFLGSLACDGIEADAGSGTVWLTAPYTEGGSFDWDLYEVAGAALITVIDSEGTNQNISFDLEIINDLVSTITVCGRAVFSGKLVGGIVFTGPVGLTPPSPFSEGPLPEGFTAALSYQDGSLDCGCDEVPSNCDPCVNSSLTWDESSASTIAQSQTVGIGVKTSGATGPFSWSISGEGFSLGASETAGRTNTVIAAADACGDATVSVSDNCGNSTGDTLTGPAGSWVFSHTDTSNACAWNSPYHTCQTTAGICGASSDANLQGSCGYYESGNTRTLYRIYGYDCVNEVSNPPNSCMPCLCNHDPGGPAASCAATIKSNEGLTCISYTIQYWYREC